MTSKIDKACEQWFIETFGGHWTGTQALSHKRSWRACAAWCAEECRKEMREYDTWETDQIVLACIARITPKDEQGKDKP